MGRNSSMVTNNEVVMPDPDELDVVTAMPSSTGFFALLR
jgi:hypothetical protein